MNTIWKYPIPIVELFTMQIPLGATILSAQFQNGELCMWLKVNTDNKLEKRTFEIFGTGHELFSAFGNRSFIATIQSDPFVWHLFERI